MHDDGSKKRSALGADYNVRLSKASGAELLSKNIKVSLKRFFEFADNGMELINDLSEYALLGDFSISY